MYLDYYGLDREPFHITPDPYFFYLSPSHKESYASLIYGLKNRKGFISLTGEVGLGKTTVIRTFLKKWSNRSKIKTVFVFNSNLSFKGLLLTIYSELGLDLPEALVSRATSPGTLHSTPVEDDAFELVRRLHSFLVQEYENGYNVILVIDDAQNMPQATLENLRMLSNLETSRDKLLQIFLIGQTELDLILDRQELRQLRQRIAIRATLKPLTREQTRDYIRHRLEKAGAKNDQDKIFTRGAVKKIYDYSRGIPRKINIICDNALITGFGYGRKTIKASVIKEVQADLEGGQKRVGFKYAWVGGAVLMLVAGGFWLSPYRDSLLSEKGRLAAWSFNAGPSETEMPQARNELAAQKTVAASLQAGNEEVVPQPEPVSPLTLEPDFPDLMDLETELAVDHQADTSNTTDEMLEQDFIEPAAVQEKMQPASAADKDEVASQVDINPEDIFIHQELSQLIPAYSDLSRTRQEVLVRMARQTSINGLMSFERMLAALERGDFQEASRQMIYSRWARAVDDYAYELAEAMRTGELGD